MEQVPTFKAGDRISASALNALAAVTTGGIGGQPGLGNRIRGERTIPRRMRGILISNLDSPSSVDSQPTTAQFLELVWGDTVLYVGDDFPFTCYNFDPDLTGRPGYYIKVEDMGDGILEVYSASCRIVYGPYMIPDEPPPVSF